MQKRYFLSNLIVVILLNILVKPVWIFLIDRNVQLKVGHQEYGLYSALFSLSLIFSIVLDFGITNYNNRHIATDNSQIHFSLPNMIAAKGIFSIFYFAAIFIAAYFFKYPPHALYVLLLLGMVQFLNSFLQFLRSNVSANHDFKIDSLLSVLDKIIMIGVCGYLLLSAATKFQFNIEWYLYAQIGAYLVSILTSIVIIVNRYAKIDFKHFSLQEMKSFCIKSLPYALLILLMGIYMRSDSLLLERIDGAESSSIYAEAYRILDALNMIGFLLAGILLPMFTRMLSKNNNVHEIVKTSTNIIFSLSLCIVAHSIVYKHDIMFFLDKNAVAELPSIYFWVICSFPAFCIMYIYSTLLTANGDILLLVKIALLGCILCIGLNLLFIPHFHAMGAGIAGLLVQLTMASCSIFFCVKKFHLPVNISWLSKFFFLFVIMFGLNVFCKYLNITLLPSVGINAIGFLLYVYISKLWDKQTILQYLGQYKSAE